MKHGSILSWWINNPVAANLVMLILVVAGISSYLWGVEKEPFPTVKFLQMNVSIRWQGANPRDIEDQILVRLEDSVKNIEGVKEVYSQAGEGWGRVSVRGKERIDRRTFAEEVREKVASVNGLPADADRPVVREATNRNEMIRIALHGPLDELSMNKLARDIRKEIAALPLISSVSLQGDSDEEISIEISEDALRHFNMSFDEISNAIRESSVNVSTGVIRGETGAVQLSVRSRAEDRAAFEDIVLRKKNDGAELRLGDVAEVVSGLKEAYRVSAFDGEQAILLNVMNGDYMDIPRMSDSVREYITRRQKSLPENVQLTIWSDWNDAYQDRLSMLFWNALSGLGLVLLLLMLFLQPKIAFWVAAGIATAFAASFWLMPALDVSLTMLSLFAFLMVIGIVVDDAIVIGESIHRANERGFHDENAALVGVTEVAKPVTFGVITTMIVFAPMAFLPGVTAEFTRSISIVVCLALSFSLFEALCILPSHLRHLRHAEEKQQSTSALGRLQRRVSHAFERAVTRYYEPTIEWSLTHRYSVILAFIGCFSIAVSLINFNFVQQSFMPEIADDKIKVKVSMPEMTSRERMEQVMQQVNAGMDKLSAYAASLDTEETGLIEHFYTELRSTRVSSQIKFVPEDQRAISIPEAANKLREFIDEIPDAEEIELSSTLNTVDPRIGYTLSSHNSEALANAVIDFKDHLATYEGVYLVRDNVDKGGVEYVFELKPGADALGLNIREVSKQLRQAYFGQEVQRLPREGGDTRIRVRYTKSERDSLQTLENMRVRTRDGSEIPLMSVVDIHIQPAVQRVERRDGYKVAYISAEYAGTQINEIKKAIAKDFVPEWRQRHPEVKEGMGRRGRGKDEFMKTVLRYESMAFLFAYVLMAIAFRSYFQPLLLMSAVPFGYMGAVVGHLLHGVEYGMFSMLGILAASGVVINDNLVLLDCINRLRAKGVPAWEAAKKAGRLRFRPIILTSLTTFVGLLPMLSAQSVQAQFLIPMVVSLAYGVLSATFITLIFVPCLYVVSARVGERIKAFYSSGSSNPSGKISPETE